MFFLLPGPKAEIEVKHQNALEKRRTKDLDVGNTISLR